MTFNDDRRNEALAACDEFPQAWWTVLHAMHGTPKGFEPSRPDGELWTTGYDESPGYSDSLGAKSRTSSSTR